VISVGIGDLQEILLNLLVEWNIQVSCSSLTWRGRMAFPHRFSDRARVPPPGASRAVERKLPVFGLEGVVSCHAEGGDAEVSHGEPALHLVVVQAMKEIRQAYRAGRCGRLKRGKACGIIDYVIG